MRIDRGTGCFTAPMNASADRSETRATCASSPAAAAAWWRLCGFERGRYLPTVPATDRASDTSVASPSFAECRSAFASPSAFALTSFVAFPREEAAEVALTTAS